MEEELRRFKYERKETEDYLTKVYDHPTLPHSPTPPEKLLADASTEEGIRRSKRCIIELRPTLRKFIYKYFRPPGDRCPLPRIWRALSHEKREDVCWRSLKVGMDASRSRFSGRFTPEVRVSKLLENEGSGFLKLLDEAGWERWETVNKNDLLNPTNRQPHLVPNERFDEWCSRSGFAADVKQLLELERTQCILTVLLDIVKRVFDVYKETRECIVCKLKDSELLGDGKKLLVCEPCKKMGAQGENIRYCSRDCQRIDWKERGHRRWCGLPVALTNPKS